MTYDNKAAHKADARTISDDLSRGMIKKIVFLIVVAPFANILCGLAMAWPVMISMGILHSHWAVIPAFGFWEMALIIFLYGYLLDTLAQLNKAAK